MNKNRTLIIIGFLATFLSIVVFFLGKTLNCLEQYYSFTFCRFIIGFGVLLPLLFFGGITMIFLGYKK
jgi:hypothetical protein